jgi:hypothetical protein
MLLGGWGIETLDWSLIRTNHGEGDNQPRSAMAGVDRATRAPPRFGSSIHYPNGIAIAVASSYNRSWGVREFHRNKKGGCL